MKVRLGYVAISKTMDLTSSSIVTYTEYLKRKDMQKIHNTIIKNLESLKEIIKYNIANDIHFFRLTSKLIPLATKEEVVFDYIKPYKSYYEEIKILIKNLRIDVHPDQYTVLNSTREEVVKNSIENIKYNYNILEALGIKNKLILIHVGSSVLGKKNSIHRFINNFNKLSSNLKNSIAIENDDKVYNIIDCLNISEKLKIPFVLDYHHYNCNNDGESLEENIPRIFNSWKNDKPKIHFSSPKSKLKKEYRSHHDYIDVLEFMFFLDILKQFNTDVDIMLEAKAKDDALFKLIRQLRYYGYEINGTTIIINK